ncbi:DUF2892 domain-containing protein [Brevibacillus sp. HB1.2]|uniref:YgaP family membrane protein n=1 Tax=Brevibacillus sp. HB1.2 TaxID=2738807 RepID=UPI001575B5A1|nr:DUF2892 domain-containing protein [Brevibacillus sp. HB1.2]NTU23451.1 DUF2892 domain-containing protein [Brevibacillus sp. HB1.2]
MKNVGRFDQMFRFVAGLAFLSLFFFQGGYQYLSLIGIPLLYTALTKQCFFYRIFGINSCQLPSQKS